MRCRRWPSPRSDRLGTPDYPAVRFTQGTYFVASLVRFRYGLSGCSPPCADLTELPRPTGAFTSRLPTSQSPFPPLDITTTVTGLLCWRDSHPLEWQLASLRQTPACRITAVGSSGRTRRAGPRSRDPGSQKQMTLKELSVGLLRGSEDVTIQRRVRSKRAGSLTKQLSAPMSS